MFTKVKCFKQFLHTSPPVYRQGWWLRDRYGFWIETQNHAKHSLMRTPFTGRYVVTCGRTFRQQERLAVLKCVSLPQMVIVNAQFAAKILHYLSTLTKFHWRPVCLSTSHKRAQHDVMLRESCRRLMRIRRCSTQHRRNDVPQRCHDMWPMSRCVTKCHEMWPNVTTCDLLRRETTKPTPSGVRKVSPDVYGTRRSGRDLWVLNWVRVCSQDSCLENGSDITYYFLFTPICLLEN